MITKIPSAKSVLDTDMRMPLHVRAKNLSPLQQSGPMCTTRTPTRGACGFTLLELLAVIGIISILLGMLLTAINSVTRFSRRTVARSEVKMLENAWKQYLEHYGHWPTNTGFRSDGILLSGVPGVPDNGDTYRVDAELARALEGRAEACEALGFNPGLLSFMEFTRRAGGVPINPWTRKIGVDIDGQDEPPDGRHFYFRLDINAEGHLDVPGPVPEDFPSTVAREVIVWTYDDLKRIIGSWQ